MKLLATLLLLVVAIPAEAQTFPLKIHGHPQKQFYNSRAEFPTFDPQGHWQPGNPKVPIPAGEAIVLTHVAHITLTCPAYAEFTKDQSFTCDFIIKSFHLYGEVADFYAAILQGRAARDIIWDVTGNVQPKMIGDPNGLKQWGGKFTVDPDPNFPHGWIEIAASSAVILTNGDSNRVNSHVPIFSMYDTTKPEEYGFPMVSSRVTPASPRRPDVQFGANQLDILDYLPIITFSKPWTVRVSPIRYGTLSNLPLPTFKIVADLDLHNGVPGRTLYTLVDPANTITVTLYPEDIGPGVHKIAMFLIQPDGGLEEATSIVTFTVTIGDDVEPPPPMPVWKTIDQIIDGADTITIQKFGTERKWRMCVNNVCGPEQIGD